MQFILPFSFGGRFFSDPRAPSRVCVLSIHDSLIIVILLVPGNTLDFQPWFISLSFSQ